MAELVGSDNSVGRKTVGEKILSGVLSLIPWVIIVGLLYAGFFVKPHVVIQEVTPPPIERRDHIYGIAAIDSEKLWIAGSYGKVLRSNDGGKDWVIQPTPDRTHLQDISAWDDMRAVAVGNKAIVIITSDGGKTWREVDAPKSEIANKLIRVHTYKNGEAWAVGEMGAILMTKDYGVTWKRMREEEDVIVNDIARIDDHKLLAVGEYARIFSSDDNGQTWVDGVTQSPGTLTAVKFRDPNDGVIVGLDGVILGTRDGGTTWTMYDSTVTGNSEHLMDVAWSDEKKMWIAVGNKGKYVKFSGDLNDFFAGTLSKTELLSHTELAIVKGGFVTVGASVGYFNLDTLKFKDLGK